ncbi:MAG: hypothetical protein A3F90_01050 [Deltaproteobacteria bacterium RIFCSPLOWO2_12_FULL_60_19]|nr:MAG: hypothetical protein A3F90_01050 [Deltaproteobacteria bacterium RIFCSPLOWO2_12_FULL_60_19]
MKQRRIIWAVNPFEEERKLLRNAVFLLRTLSAKAQFEIEPVYVVSPAELRVSLEFSVPEEERLHTVAKQALDRAVQILRLANLLEPKVLVTHGLSLEATTTALWRHAETNGAELIVAGTHARKGVDRFMLGSFAENLLVLSRVPVLLVNLGLKPVRNIRRVVFASDFSPESRKAFRRFCETFAPMNAEIFLYHAVPRPPKWTIQSGTNLFVGDATKSRQEKLSMRKKLARPFLEEATAAKARVEISVEEVEGKIHEAIVRKAVKERASVIGMASRTGTVAATLLGSATRGVVRHSPVSVWVFRA